MLIVNDTMKIIEDINAIAKSVFNGDNYVFNKGIIEVRNTGQYNYVQYKPKFAKKINAYYEENIIDKTFALSSMDFFDFHKIHKREFDEILFIDSEEDELSDIKLIKNKKILSMIPLENKTQITIISNLGY